MKNKYLSSVLELHPLHAKFKNGIVSFHSLLISNFILTSSDLYIFEIIDLENVVLESRIYLDSATFKIQA